MQCDNALNSQREVICPVNAAKGHNMPSNIPVLRNCTAWIYFNNQTHVKKILLKILTQKFLPKNFNRLYRNNIEFATTGTYFCFKQTPLNCMYTIIIICQGKK